MPAEEGASFAPLYLSATDCQAALTPEAIVGAVEDALRWEVEGGVVWPDPRHLKLSDSLGGRYHIKACVLEPAGVAGVRLVAHQADEAAGEATRWVILIDPRTTRPLAIVDETWNYAQRTAAVMAVAARYLVYDGAGGRAARGAGRGRRSLALVGAGRLATAALTYFAHLFDLSEVRVVSRREETRAALARRARDDHGLPANTTDSVEAAVRGADLVLTSTSAGRPMLEADWIKPGAVVGCLDTAEPGAELVRKADYLIVDSREQLAEELLELYGPEAPVGVDATIGEVVAGRFTAARSPEDRILVVSQGLASLDVAVAARAYARRQERGKRG